MSSQPTKSRGAGRQSEKQMRKGTRSCVECRRRKTRCVFRSEVATTCLECFSRGTSCTPQTNGGLQTRNADPKTSLKDRVAQLESLPATLVPGDGNCKKLTDPGSVCLTATGPTTESADANHEDAPLLSIFERPAKTLMKAACRQEPKSGRICHTLLALLPSPRDLELILTATSSWWQSWQPLCPHLRAQKRQQSLEEFVSWAAGQKDPAIVALAILCVVIAIQQVPPGTHRDVYGSSLPLKTLMDTCLSTVESLVISDDECSGCSQGIEVMALQSNCYVSLGRPQKAWLLLHRAISIAQLIGLHREGKFRQKDISMTNEERQNLWWTLNELDRYLSLVLGLPHAVNEGTFSSDVQAQPSDELNTTTYRRKLSLMAGHIADRNKTFSPNSISPTLDMDAQLDAIEKSLPSELRHPQFACASDTDGLMCQRLMIRFWHYQLEVFLHLPFLMQSRANRALGNSHSACFAASRKMLWLYHAMRFDERAAFHMCSVIDFQGFTAALLLLLGLLGYREASGGDGEKDGDLVLIEATIRVLERASGEYGGLVATQAVQVLKRIMDILAGIGAGDSEAKSAWTESIPVPYFGVITISTGDPSPSAVPSQSSANGMSNLAIESWDGGLPENLMLHADVDWYALVNMDLDQDWNWLSGDSGASYVALNT